MFLVNLFHARDNPSWENIAFSDKHIFLFFYPCVCFCAEISFDFLKKVFVVTYDGPGGSQFSFIFSQSSFFFQVCYQLSIIRRNSYTHAYILGKLAFGGNFNSTSLSHLIHKV